jgi:hypothetical protein
MLDEFKVASSGSQYSVGEIDQTHPHLSYLSPGALVCKFEGVDTLLDYVSKHMSKPQREGESSSTESGDFHAFVSYAQAMDIFRSHPEQVVKFDPAELRIKDSTESGNQVEFEVTGEYIDIGRYLEGIPETFGSMRQGNARNRRVNIILNLSQGHYLSHDDIRHRGERILRLVDALESGGVRTQLTGIESTQCGHFEVLLKHHDEPLTITDLAVVSHPEFLRRILFRFKEYSKTWYYGYGSSVVFSDRLTPEFIDNGINDELDIVIDCNLVGIAKIDTTFEQLERLLVWEMSKPVPEVSSVKLDKNGIWFNPSGARGEAEIKREGLEAIRG